jgi:hypothetical protein
MTSERTPIFGGCLACAEREQHSGVGTGENRLVDFVHPVGG